MSGIFPKLLWLIVSFIWVWKYQIRWEGNWWDIDLCDEGCMDGVLDESGVNVTWTILGWAFCEKKIFPQIFPAHPPHFPPTLRKKIHTTFIITIHPPQPHHNSDPIPILTTISILIAHHHPQHIINSAYSNHIPTQPPFPTNTTIPKSQHRRIF